MPLQQVGNSLGNATRSDAEVRAKFIEEEDR